MSSIEDRLSTLLAEAPPEMPPLDFGGVVTKVRQRRTRLAAAGVTATAIVAVSLLLPFAVSRSATPATVRPTLVKPTAVVAVPTDPRILAVEGDGGLAIYGAGSRLQRQVPLAKVSAVATNPAGGWIVASGTGTTAGQPCPHGDSTSALRLVDSSGKVTSGPGTASGDVLSLAVTPDATRVAVATASDCGTAPARITVLAMNARTPPRVWELPAAQGNWITDLSWAPDGRHLTFTPGEQTGAGAGSAGATLDTQAPGTLLPDIPRPFVPLADGCTITRRIWLGLTGKQAVYAECAPKSLDSELVPVTPGTTRPTGPAVRFPFQGNADEELSTTPDGHVLVAAASGAWRDDDGQVHQLFPVDGPRQPAWEGVGPAPAAPAAVPTADYFGSVQFVSPTHGWVVGSDGILATTDGGAHWRPQLSQTGIGLTSLDAFDRRHAWAVGGGHVLRTTDGVHWASLPDVTAGLRTLHFLTPLAGFAIAGGDTDGSPTDPMPSTGGVVLRTTDGGDTWTAVTAPRDAQSICLSTSGSGWLAAGGKLYRSTDDAISWQPSLVLPGGADTKTRVECAGPQAAWAVSTIENAETGGQYQHEAFHTDGGPWRAVYENPYFDDTLQGFEGASPGAAAGPFSAIGPETAFFLDTCACGSGTVPAAVVTGTHQRDTITKRPDVGLLTSLDGLSFSDSQHGWATGQLVTPSATAAGTSTSTWRIVATSDGGRSWHLQLDGRR